VKETAVEGRKEREGGREALGKHIYKCAINIDLINLLTSISTHIAITTQVSVCASPPKKSKKKNKKPNARNAIVM